MGHTSAATTSTTTTTVTLPKGPSTDKRTSNPIGAEKAKGGKGKGKGDKGKETEKDDEKVARRKGPAGRLRAKRTDIKKSSELDSSKFFPLSQVQQLIMTVGLQYLGKAPHVSHEARQAIRDALIDRSSRILTTSGTLTRDIRDRVITSEKDVAFGIESLRRQSPAGWQPSDMPFAITRSEHGQLKAV